MWRIYFLSMVCIVLVSSCSVDNNSTLQANLNAPVSKSLSPTSPTASAKPSEDTDPPCFVALQCIVDNTSDNALRKEAQEVINQLIQTTEPRFTQICLTRSTELLPKQPSCQRKL